MVNYPGVPQSGGLPKCIRKRLVSHWEWDMMGAAAAATQLTMMYMQSLKTTKKTAVLDAVRKSTGSFMAFLTCRARTHTRHT